MEQTLSNSVSSSPANEAKKQRKKQAKREAKTMLAVEQAKQDVMRAEQKVAKSQARLEARVAHLHTLEAKLAKIRKASQESEADTSSGSFDGPQEQPEAAQEGVGPSTSDVQPVVTPATSDNAQAAAPDGPSTSDAQPDIMTEEDEASTGESAQASLENAPPPTDQQVSLPPAEGRADILQDQEGASSEEDNYEQGVNSENEGAPADDIEDDDSDSEETRTQKRTLRFRRRFGPFGHPQTEEESYTQLEEAVSQDIDVGDTDY